MQEYKAMWKNYANFKDRTSVKGYWMVILFNLIINIVLSILTNFVDAIAIVAGLYSLAILIPSLAISVRRLHDINKSGWWLFLSLIPFIGGIILLIWSCKGSVEDGNQYGVQV